MADFCKQCSMETFGRDYGDLANLRPGEKLGKDEGWLVICEGCGPALVNNKGECISLHCDQKHGVKK